MPTNAQGESYEVREKNGLIYHFYPNRKGKNQWVYVRWNDANLGAVGLKPDGSKVGQPAPAAPPAPTPVIQPFFSAGDLQDLASFTASYETQLADLDRAFADLKVQTTYDKTKVDQSAKENKAGTTDQMIARGLFQSSIKDGALYDIEAQRVMQQAFLDDRLTTTTLDVDRKKKILEQSKIDFTNAQNLKAIQNAAEISANQAPPPGEPAAPAAAPGAPAPAAKTWKTVIRDGWVWHDYPDGRKVKVRPQSSPKGR